MEEVKRLKELTEELAKLRAEQERAERVKRAPVLDWIAPDDDPLFVQLPLYAFRIHFSAGKLPGWFITKLGARVQQRNFVIELDRTVVGDFCEDDETLEHYLECSVTPTPRAMLRVRKEDVIP